MGPGWVEGRVMKCVCGEAEREKGRKIDRKGGRER